MISDTEIIAVIPSKGLISHSRTDADKYKILVVDDEPAVRKTLGAALSRSGFDVAYAVDGFEADRKTIQFQPHIVILDIFMPKIDGFEVCQRIKGNLDSAKMKIIAISGYESKDIQQQIFRCGADRFFLKPLNLTELISEITHLLGMNPTEGSQC